MPLDSAWRRAGWTRSPRWPCWAAGMPSPRLRGTDASCAPPPSHVATVLAVVVVFRREMSALVRGVREGGEQRLLVLRIAVATVPAGIAGLLLRDFVAALPERAPLAIPVCWLVMAGVLLSLKWCRSDHLPIGWGAALWIGSLQVFALLPGISRSGITIAAALWIGRKREDAASFSFMVAIPLILAAALLELVRGFSDGFGVSASDLPRHFVAGGVAFLTGWLALVLLLKMLRHGKLYLWSGYLVVVAVAYGGWILSGGS